MQPFDTMLVHDHGDDNAVCICRTIAQQTRADRHTLMFSATWPSSIQKLAAEFLCNPVKVTIGSQDLSASHSVTQVPCAAFVSTSCTVAPYLHPAVTL